MSTSPVSYIGNSPLSSHPPGMRPKSPPCPTKKFCRACHEVEQPPLELYIYDHLEEERRGRLPVGMEPPPSKAPKPFLVSTTEVSLDLVDAMSEQMIRGLHLKEVRGVTVPSAELLPLNKDLTFPLIHKPPLTYVSFPVI